MKQRIYRALVDRTPGIRDRYLSLRRRRKRLTALAYLLWLNIRYSLFLDRRLEEPERFPAYEEKRLREEGSESSLSYREPPEVFAEKLAAADVISFDVFDTLLFRPFSHPADVFFLVGMELRYPDFRRIRMEAEESARRKKDAVQGIREVTLEEIWEEMEQETGIPKELGMRTEWEYEQRSCCANPYLLRVVRALRERGKRLVATSDMYLGGEKIRALLAACGYGPFEDCFVSSDYGVSKSDGRKRAEMACMSTSETIGFPTASRLRAAASERIGIPMSTRREGASARRICPL